VHDELVYEVKDSLVEEMTRDFKEIMEKALPEEKSLGVPIVAEVQVGENWGEMKRYEK
jgi:DNA polymerase I-like protein with 3'-5' exonuclease and polymerase domains